MSYYGHDRMELTGDWYCTKCDWEGCTPAANYYKANGMVYADDVWCPHCKDGGDLKDGFRPEVNESEEDAA